MVYIRCGTPRTLGGRPVFGTCVGGCFIGGGFKILDVAQNNLANSTVVKQTRLATACFLKPPPLKPPPTQVPTTTTIIIIIINSIIIIVINDNHDFYYY